jgi:RecB family endonuclease NucS
MVLQKRHFIILKKPDGTTEKHPMKQWLRQHPEYLPKGLSATSNTSHELRGALKRARGAELQETEDEVLVILKLGENDVDFNEITDVEEEVNEEITFGLERDMQKALRANIGQLEEGLKIIDNGMERITEAGRIDITAEDKNGAVVVIELKAGTADPDVIAQILAYIGAISETEKKPIRGILVAGDFHKRVTLAVKATPNLRLFRYSFKFTFEPVS